MEKVLGPDHPDTPKASRRWLLLVILHLQQWLSFRLTKQGLLTNKPWLAPGSLAFQKIFTIEVLFILHILYTTIRQFNASSSIQANLCNNVLNPP